MKPEVLKVLRERFGLESLYPVQERIIDRLMEGGHAMVVLPTGSGKSLCYQLPALALPGPGTSLIFSPLIALMEDQVASLKERGIRAEFINSTLDRKTREKRYEELAAGEYEMVYATPERMEKPEFTSALRDMPGGVRLLAVDEAHCITRWGHDFRPSYQRIGEFHRQLGSPLTVALTATATPAVREDIRRTLDMDEEEMPLFAAGIDRPNLTFEVEKVWSKEDKVQAIRNIAASSEGTGIVYFSLIKTLEEFAHEFHMGGHSGQVEIYHGKLDPDRKRSVYERFTTARPPDRLLLLATNAFGMGVDKPDIRYIVHAQIPGSVEAYYQEVGRAGRDGEKSRCLLLYEEADLYIQQEFIRWMNPTAEFLERAARIFQDHPLLPINADDLRERTSGRDRGDRRAEYCLIALEKMGVIEPAPHAEHYQYVRPIASEDIDPAELEAKKKRDLQRLLDMVQLARAEDVRSFVLSYFGLD